VQVFFVIHASKLGKMGQCYVCPIQKADIKGFGDLRMISIWCLLSVPSESRQHLCKLWDTANNPLLVKLTGGVVQLQPGSSATWGVLGSSHEQIWVLGSKIKVRGKESLTFVELMDLKQK